MIQVFRMCKKAKDINLAEEVFPHVGGPHGKPITDASEYHSVINLVVIISVHQKNAPFWNPFWNHFSITFSH